jgi:arginyl-tRNA synthetase
MTFADLKSACDDFRAILREATGRELVTAVSVDEPIDPQDELHFVKLVSWCYVVLFEASQPTTRYILSLLRAGDPSEHKTAASVIENVNHLRTVRVHNLSPESRGDDHKRRQASIWLLQSGGEPTDWPRCCESLCAEVTSAIRLLIDKWRRITASTEDRTAVIQDLIVTIDREWPPNTFDRIVEGAAQEIGLQGFDCVKYRQHRLERWRELVGFFESREHAEAAMRAAIHRELEQLFGTLTSRSGEAKLRKAQPTPTSIFSLILSRTHTALAALEREGGVPAGLDTSRIVVEPPRDPAHGDMATNAAMVLAKDARMKPRELAEAIAAELCKDALVAKVEVAGPGFINVTLKPAAWIDELRAVIEAGADYGRSDIGKAERINVEYVSANPTGPMHVGHGRGAVFGDALANLLAFAGFAVTREYYINDAGAQVDVLARSAYLRYREALGEDIGAIPEGLYPGDYLKPVGQQLAVTHGSRLLHQPESRWLPVVRQAAVEAMLAAVMEDLAALNIRFDAFFSEKALSEGTLKFFPQSGRPVFYCAKDSYSLMEGGAGGIRSYLAGQEIDKKIEAGAFPISDVFATQPADGDLGRPDYLGSVLRGLQEAGLIYQGRLPPPKGGATDDWEDREQTLFRATQFGDDIDRPLMKSDGSYTYFAADIAYHRSKFDRGFRQMIDVWGADHGGYVKRMQAAVKAVSGGAAELDVKIVQLVKLLRAGDPVKMSKRAGDFVTLREVVDEVGRDAVRFDMLFRKNDAVLDFDLAKVIEQSRDNPVFYVQYAHARAQSVFRNAREVLPDLPPDARARAAMLAQVPMGFSEAEEFALMKRLALYPRTVEAAALAHEPHRIAFYLFDLASEFHALWTRGKDMPHLRFIIQDDPQLTMMRLALIHGVASVLASGLDLLGVEAPAEMR